MAKWNDFYQETIALLGKENVIVERDDVLAATHETGHAQITPRLILYPGSTHDVQSIVKIANRLKIPVFSSSTGCNWGYGGNNPTDQDSAIIVLSRMNRVLSVDSELAYAVIEPGVSYEQFNQYLKDNHIPLWIDCTDGPPFGSVLGNALDRGIGETPYGDHYGNLCGLEVVLPNGELIHTGLSSPRHPIKTWHTHKWGLGPSIDGLFTQSNFGIVTKAGIWLMPEPKSYSSYIFELENDENLGSTIDRFRNLALNGVVNSKLHLISDFVSATILTQRRDSPPKASHYSAAELQSIRRRLGFARWSGGAALYGDPAYVRLQKKQLRKALNPFGRILFFTDRTVKALELLLQYIERRPILISALETVSRRSIRMIRAIPYVHRLLQGVPTRYFLNHSYFKVDYPRPSGETPLATKDIGLTWFAPILPFTGADIVPYLTETRALFEQYGFDYYMAMLMLNPRSCVCLMGILYDKSSADEGIRAKRLYEALTTHMHEKNYQQYRAGLAGWPRLFEKAPELKTFFDAIQSALDPNHIMAPGRYGITGPCPASPIE